jgi:hypothetical protein
MRFTPASTRWATLLPLAALPLAALLLAGCGKGSHEQAATGGGPPSKVAAIARQGAVSVTTRNTTRVGGASTAIDAAAIARVAYTGLTAESRPQAVVLVNQRDWPAALAASSLAGAPLHAPILFTEGNTLPPVSLQALEAMHPTGAAALGGAQVIRIASQAPVPARYRLRSLPAAGPAPAAAAIERLLIEVAGLALTRHALVLRSDAPKALQMPFAGLAAESGTPVLFADGPTLPPATAAVLSSLRRPTIFTTDATRLATGALGGLARLGSVTAIPAGGQKGVTTAQLNSIEAARYTDGSFGWGVKEPGHGLVFASSGRPLDAPAAALLSATGEYGPLLLLEAPIGVGGALSTYLADIQPAYAAAPEYQPVRGVYNHGWLVGDEQSISLVTQTQLDSMLEISPRKAGAGGASALQPE